MFAVFPCCASAVAYKSFRSHAVDMCARAVPYRSQQENVFERAVSYKIMPTRKPTPYRYTVRIIPRIL